MGEFDLVRDSPTCPRMMAMREPIPQHKKPTRPTTNEAVQAAERDAVPGRGGGEELVIGMGTCEVQADDRLDV
jgi:hypothetical protein